jgi:cation transport ATPase
MSEKLATLNTPQKLSIWLSSLCLIHCLITPFIIILLPSVSGFFSGWIEALLIFAVVPISSIAFFPIWVKHKNKTRLVEFLAGICIVIIVQLFFHDFDHSGFHFNQIVETILMVVGTGLIAFATYRNRRHTHTCSVPAHQH